MFIHFIEMREDCGVGEGRIKKQKRDQGLEGSGDHPWFELIRLNIGVASASALKLVSDRNTLRNLSIYLSI